MKNSPLNGKFLCRHRNVLKSTIMVKALSRLAGGNPRGCNVGIRNGAVAEAAALFVLSVSEWLEVTNCDLKCKKGV